MRRGVGIIGRRASFAAGTIVCLLAACSGIVRNESASARDGGASGGAAGKAGFAGGAGGIGTAGAFAVGGSLDVGGQSTGGARPVIVNCPDPKARLGSDGKPTGFFDCGNGALHRAEKRDCPATLPRAAACPAADSCASMNRALGDAGVRSACGAQPCRVDSDCRELANGFCRTDIRCLCDYGCVRDEDCRAGEICVCGDPVGTCARAECTEDADCNGRFCMRTSDPAACPNWFACHVGSGDECRGESDCATRTAAIICRLVSGSQLCEPPECL